METCAGNGLDLAKTDMAPCAPRPHILHDGPGVKPILWGRTSLFCGVDAAGTSARRRDGANRLAQPFHDGRFGLRGARRAGDHQDEPVESEAGAALPGNPAPCRESRRRHKKDFAKANQKPDEDCATLEENRDGDLWREGRDFAPAGRNWTDHRIKQLADAVVAEIGEAGRAGHELRNCMRLGCLSRARGLARAKRAAGSPTAGFSVPE